MKPPRTPTRWLVLGLAVAVAVVGVVIWRSLQSGDAADPLIGT